MMVGHISQMMMMGGKNTHDTNSQFGRNHYARVHVRWEDRLLHGGVPSYKLQHMQVFQSAFLET